MNSRYRLRIIDDSPEDCEAYVRTMERQGFPAYDFEIAHSAASGLKLCRKTPPDCILLDFNLPDCDGLNTFVQLKEQVGELGAPIIMVTGHGNEAVAVQAMKMGAEDYLVKSLKNDGLVRVTQCHGECDAAATSSGAPARSVTFVIRTDAAAGRAGTSRRRVVGSVLRKAAMFHARSITWMVVVILLFTIPFTLICLSKFHVIEPVIPVDWLPRHFLLMQRTEIGNTKHDVRLIGAPILQYEIDACLRRYGLPDRTGYLQEGTTEILYLFYDTKEIK